MMEKRTLNPTQQQAEAAFQRAIGLHKDKKLPEAVEQYARALAFNPRHVHALNNMGIALRAQGHWDAALIAYRRALLLAPEAASTHSNLGNLYNDMDCLDQACHHHEIATNTEPDSSQFLINQAIGQRDSGQLTDAIVTFRKALNLAPDHPTCEWDLALTYLMDGQFKRGFDHYEARWKLDYSGPRRFNAPRWKGEDLGGKTLFIHREQGFGDAIQFLRLLPAIKDRFGGKIKLECQPKLTRLFHQVNCVDQLIPFQQDPGPFDYWIPLMSLPRFLDISPDHIPGKVPFLTTPPPAQPIPRFNGTFNMGIVWAGSPTHKNDHRRSCGLLPFLKLAQHPRLRTFSFQKGPAEDDLKQNGVEHLITNLSPQIDDFLDTAILIKQMDLIVTVDTSVAHLAAAIGKPTWVALPYTPDWRWMWHRDDSPWYPTLKLFRQPRPKDWDGVFTALSDALDRFVDSNLTR